MITRVELVRFRGFERLRAELAPHAYLVGPNSAGKSTILEALGFADQCLRTARRKPPSSSAFHNGRHVLCYPLVTRIGDDEDPIRHDFGQEETSISVQWASGGRIHIVWPEEEDRGEDGFFYLDDETHHRQPRTPAATRTLFSPVTIIPVITPLDRFEEVKNPVYVEGKSNTRLASRHFRNHAWSMSESGQWSSFKEFCDLWLPEIRLLDVVRNVGANRLAVFYSEEGSRVPKELAWAGDGIQIWVQLLWHLFSATETKSIVLDEPEVYLHPDLQRRLIRLLDGMSAQIILASHSADVIAEAPSGGVLWVDRRLNRARRIESQQSLSNLSASLGSSYDLALARSMRARLVIASDSEDLRIIRVLAKHVGAVRIANEHAVSLVQLREVGSWSGSRHLGQSLRSVLPANLPAIVLLQAGHRPENLNKQIATHLTAPGVSVILWTRAELENYLLDAETIARVSGAAIETVEMHISSACSDLRASTRAAFTSTWVSAAEEGRAHETLIQAEQVFDEDWSDDRRRLEVVRGSQVIRELNLWLERDGYRPISGYALAKSIKPQALSSEVLSVVLGIDDMIG